MKSLVQFILESMSRKDLIDYISNNLEKLSDMELNRIYDLINPMDLSALETFLTERGLIAVQDNIISYFEKRGDLNKLIEYIQSSEMLDASAIAGTGEDLTSGNVIDICCNPSKNFKFNKDAVTRLQKETTAGGIKVGEFEYMLRVFLNKLDINDHHGDIVSGNYRIEVKAGDARIAGVGTQPPQIIRQTANKLLSQHGLEEVDVKEFNGRGGAKIAPDFFEKIYKLTNDKDFVCTLLLESYISQYSTTEAIKYKGQLQDLVNKHLFSGDHLDRDAVRYLIATIALFSYAKSEGFYYFLVINKKNGDFYCLNALSNNFINTAYDAFAKGLIKVKSIQNEQDNIYGKGIQICYNR